MGFIDSVTLAVFAAQIVILKFSAVVFFKRFSTLFRVVSPFLQDDNISSCNYTFCFIFLNGFIVTHEGKKKSYTVVFLN